MSIKIETSLNLDEKTFSDLKLHFHNDFYEIEKSIFNPGMATTYFVFNFVVSSLLGGYLYDKFKESLVKFRNRTEKNRNEIITVKLDNKYYKIIGSEVSLMNENGKFIIIDFDLLLKNIDELKKKSEDNKA